jgi:hypothetical protein
VTYYQDSEGVRGVVDMEGFPVTAGVKGGSIPLRRAIKAEWSSAEMRSSVHLAGAPCYLARRGAPGSPNPRHNADHLMKQPTSYKLDSSEDPKRIVNAWVVGKKRSVPDWAYPLSLRPAVEKLIALSDSMIDRITRPPRPR